MPRNHHHMFTATLTPFADAMAAMPRDHAATPLFDRADWYALLHAHCLPDRTAWLAAAANARLVLMTGERPRELAALANWYSFHWHPTGADGPEGAAALTAIARLLRRHAARLTLAPLPTEAGEADRIAAGLRAAGWRVFVDETSHNHWLEPAGRDFASWWASRPGALRSTVKRKGAKGLVALTIHHDFSDALWDDFEAVYAASWKPAEGSPAFLRALARQCAARGALRLGIARIDGRPVAAQFWTSEGGVALIHKLAHVEGVEAHSPGTLLTHALFAEAFDRDRVHRIDFGTGDDGYKRDWMEASAPLATITAFDPAQPAIWPALAKKALSRLAARHLRR